MTAHALPTPAPTSPTDQALLHEYASTKSDPAFAALVARHLGWVYGIALRKTRDPSLAEDVTQAVFLALSAKAEKLSGHPSLSAWLFTATRLAAADLLRRRHRQQERDHMAHLAKMSLADSAPNPDLAEKIDDALAALPHKYRDVILLHFYNQFSPPTIAAQLGITEHAIRKRLTRALEKLRTRLAPPIPAENLSVSLAALVATPAPAHLAQTLLAGKATAAAIAASAALHAPMTALAKLAIAGALCATVGITAAVVLAQSQHTPTPPTTTSFLSSQPTITTAASQPTTAPAIAAALAKIHTLHGKYISTLAGDHAPHNIDETYWDIDHGMLRRQTYPQAAYITRIDGDQIYKYREGRTQALEDKAWEWFRPREPSVRTLINNDLLYQGNYRTRAPELDRVINGQTSRAFTAPDDDNRTDQTIWLDSNGFFAASEDTWVWESGAAPQHCIRELTQNPALPPDFWTRPPGLQIVNPRELLQQQFPLASTLFQQEVHGSIVAVHSLRQDANGNFYLLVSARMTPETFKLLEHVPMGEGFGIPNSFFRLLSMNAQSATTHKTTHDYDDHTIASIEADGICVDYVVILPHNPEAVGNRCQVGFIFSPPQTLAEFVGKTTHPPQQMVPFDLRNDQPLIDIKTFGAEAYIAADRIDVIATIQLNTNSTPTGRRLKQSSFIPGDLTQDQFTQSLSRDERNRFGWR